MFVKQVKLFNYCPDCGKSIGISPEQLKNIIFIETINIRDGDKYKQRRGIKYYKILSRNVDKSIRGIDYGECLKGDNEILCLSYNCYKLDKNNKDIIEIDYDDYLEAQWSIGRISDKQYEKALCGKEYEKYLDKLLGENNESNI